MPFSKSTFLLPVSSTDTTVKIRDLKGDIKYLLKDPNAILSLDGRLVHIKQSSDTQNIVLDFANVQHAKESIVLLQKALSSIRRNTIKVVDPVAVADQSCDNGADNVMLDDIWGESDKIPAIAPPLLVGQSSGVLQYVDVDTEMVPDTLTFYNEQFKDAVQPIKFGMTYSYMFLTKSGIIIPPNWNGLKVDESCGLVTFESLEPTDGVIIDEWHAPRIRFYLYKGRKGVVQGADGLGNTLSKKVLHPEFNGQTIFSVGSTIGVITELYINGQQIENVGNVNFSFSGGILTWTDAAFGLETDDTIVIHYYPVNTQ